MKEKRAERETASERKSEKGEDMLLNSAYARI
jgi:hypothetical protein